jgi:hypothetical protein
MIRLTDTVEIETSPEQVFEWLDHLPENYLAWHPDHVVCQYLKGTSILETGSILYVEEYLHGQLHRLKLRTTKVIPKVRLEYKAELGIAGAFEVKSKRSKILFMAEITLGTNLPGLGWALDWIIGALLSDRLEALKQHMAEEGENLKKLLEKRKPTQVRHPYVKN